MAMHVNTMIIIVRGLSVNGYARYERARTFEQVNK